MILFKQTRRMPEFDKYDTAPATYSSNLPSNSQRLLNIAHRSPSYTETISGIARAFRDPRLADRPQTGSAATKSSVRTEMVPIVLY